VEALACLTRLTNLEELAVLQQPLARPADGRPVLRLQFNKKVRSMFLLS
jgi:hypothetical protein